MTSRKVKAYAVMIGVGAAGIIADNLLRGGKPAAAVAESTGAVTQPATVDADASEKPQARLEVAGFPALFSSDPTSKNNTHRDPFAIPTATLRHLAPEQADAGTVADVDPAMPTRSDSFAEDHVLSGIIQAGDNLIAVIDNMLISTGQQLDGCTLTKIEPRIVRFECPDGEAELHFEDPLAIPSP